VKTKVRTWRLALRVLLLAVAIAAVPVPGLAQEKSPPAARPGIQASLHKVVAANPVVPTRVRAARTQTITSTPVKGSFFKTPAGMAVIGILAAGGGYAIYSVSKQGLSSPPRQ
jgi:hypothetical protein